MALEMNDSKEINGGAATSGAHKKAYVAYLAIVAAVFLAMTGVFLFFPRSTYSELEKRDLAKFPDAGLLKEDPAAFTAAVSGWFSDSEPYRDVFMTLSMQLRDLMRYTSGDPEETVSFRAAATPATSEGGSIGDPEGNPLADANAKVGNSGIVIVGTGSNVRALMAFGAGTKGGTPYIGLINEYVKEFPGVNIYALIAPLASEYYMPDKAAKVSNPQKPMIDYVRDNISPRARFVDAYGALAAHTKEDIYLRTDHHWAPLGGYYAAQQIARTAGVPFRDLSSYDRHVVRNFVGSMYGYSKDISVKNAPEDFVYYTPKGLDYTTTYVTYRLNEDYQITSQSKPYAGKFFMHFKDGSGAAYSTFMGGDQHLVKVSTGTPGSRRVLIIKDSYGNTLPGYLFYSFNEVHVVDFRYFKENMKQYVADNRITDIVIAFNVFNACSSGAAEKVKRYITQRAGDFSVTERRKEDKDTETPHDENEERHEGVHEAGHSPAQPQGNTHEEHPATEPEPEPESPAENE